MIRRAGVIVSTTLAAGLLSLAAALPAAATPKPNTDEPPISGDDRVIATYAKNANECSDAKLDGTIILQKEKPGGLTVTIKASDIPAGYDVTGIVVKGGPGFNVYPPNVLTNLRAPQNKGGQQPEISHYFVCGVKKTTSSSEPPSSSSSSSPGNGGGATTTSPAAQGSGGANGTDLANTGASTTGLLVAGGALLLIGGGLLLLLRRTRLHG